MTGLTIKEKKIVRIGNSKGIIIDQSYFTNGLLTEQDILDLEITKITRRKVKK